MNFGPWIKRIREEQGKYSTRELSRLLGKSETYVSGVERGVTKLPSPSVTVKMFDLLGVEEPDKWMKYFGIIESSGKIDDFMLSEKDHHELYSSIEDELKDMDKIQLTTTLGMLTRHKDIMKKVIELEKDGNRKEISELKNFLSYLDYKKNA